MWLDRNLTKTPLNRIPSPLISNKFQKAWFSRECLIFRGMGLLSFISCIQPILVRKTGGHWPQPPPSRLIFFFYHWWKDRLSWRFPHDPHHTPMINQCFLSLFLVLWGLNPTLPLQTHDFWTFDMSCCCLLRETFRLFFLRLRGSNLRWDWHSGDKYKIYGPPKLMFVNVEIPLNASSLYQLYRS